MESFYYTGIQDWSGQDCLSWATKTCMQLGLKFYEVDFEAFGFLSGKDLLRFTETDFCRKIDKVHGPKFYESFQAFLELYQPNNHTLQFSDKADVQYRMKDEAGYQTSKCAEPWNRTWHHICETSVEINDVYKHEYNPNKHYGREGPPHYLPTTEVTSYLVNGCPSSCREPGSEDDSSTSTESLYSSNGYRAFSMSHTGDESWGVQPDTNYKGNSEIPSDLSRSRSLSPNSLEESKEKKWKQKIKNKTRPKRVRDPFVWEFLLMLLQDKDFNPSHIRWEDQRKGTFKLIQKEEIAKEWGERTEKHKQAPLSYGHFSRSLRYHYTSGYLLPVSEKHLVYKFGPKVMEWLANDMKTPI